MPAALEYDRGGNHVTRGQFRVLLVLMFVNTIAIVGYLAVPGGTQWARQTWKEIDTKRAAKAREQQRRDATQKRIDDFQKALPALAAMKWPADTPVYTEDGIEAASLLASNPAYQTVPLERQGMEVGAWQAAVGRGMPPEAAPLDVLASRSRGSVATVFLHARKNPGGAERLIWCELDARQYASGQGSGRYAVTSHRTLRVRLIAPGSATEAPKVLAIVETEFDQPDDERAEVKRDGGETRTPQTFRLMAGVPDAADATRFTIPYVMGGARGAFVVRVLAGDRLLVEPTEGRIAERSGNTRVTQKWDPSGAPAIRVTGESPVKK